MFYRRFLVSLCITLVLINNLCSVVAQTRLPALRTHSNAVVQSVVVNGKTILKNDLAKLRSRGLKISPGRYWYDAKTGAWGIEGQGLGGFIVPSLPMGGVLKSSASEGCTGVFINGRQLVFSDVLALKGIGVTLWPGPYWCRANGECGQVGDKRVVINLRHAAKQNDVTQNTGLYDDKNIYNLDGESVACLAQNPRKAICWAPEIDRSAYGE